jgi:uncharacterized membrane protein YbhN (UPF0104 family)
MDLEPVAMLTTGTTTLALGSLAALHYLAGTATIRAASGVALPWRECYLAQLAAAAANRVIPGGAGGAALNTRYLTRRGLPRVRALGTVASMPVVGAAAKILTILLLLAVAATTHGQSTHVDPRRLAPALPGGIGLTVAVAVACVLAVVAATALRKVTTAQARAVLVDLTELRRRPRAVLTMAAASAATTVLLGVALALSTLLVAGPTAGTSALGLVIAYGLGAAAGTAVPLPGGMGTDAALVGTLAAAGVPLAHAGPAVVVFRIVTYWLPAAFGLLALRRLRRTRAL